jgi:hypothetical protein
MKKTFNFLISSLFLFASCYKEAGYEKPVSQSSFKLYPSTYSMPADSFTTITVSVELPFDASDTLSQVTFKATKGIFPEANASTITAKAKKSIDGTKKIAQVIFKSSLLPDSAVISAELFDVTQSVTINFTRAYPDKLQLMPSSFAIKPANDVSGEVSINALVSRLKGFVSLDNEVDLEAWDSSFAGHIGSFRIYNNLTNSQGQSNYVFVLGDSVANKEEKAYTGALYIIGQTLIDGTTLRKETIRLISSR